MKKILLLVVLLSTMVNINPTLKLQTSKVLTNFQGEKLFESNHTINQTINSTYNESMLILHSGLELEIQQIDEDTFKVLP